MFSSRNGTQLKQILNNSKSDAVIAFIESNKKQNFWMRTGNQFTLEISEINFQKELSVRAERQAAIKAENQNAIIIESGISREKASEISGEMYTAYQRGGVNNMLSLENSCWSTLTKRKKFNDVGATSCAIAALAGAFVEATYARQQIRSSAVPYTGASIRLRIIENMNKMGYNETQIQHIIELATAHQVSVINGLVRKGMR